jgi:predicted transcriptional regulator
LHLGKQIFRFVSDKLSITKNFHAATQLSHTAVRAALPATGQLNMDSKRAVVDQTTQIVSAYVSRHDVPRTELSKLISEVYNALANATDTDTMPSMPGQSGNASQQQTIFPDYIVCLEDGKQFKSLKRHLRVKYQMTPEQYRVRWSLPPDYPMVAPNYAETRSSLAKSMGLGKRTRTALA